MNKNIIIIIVVILVVVFILCLCKTGSTRYSEGGLLGSSEEYVKYGDYVALWSPCSGYMGCRNSYAEPGIDNLDDAIIMQIVPITGGETDQVLTVNSPFGLATINGTCGNAKPFKPAYLGWRDFPYDAFTFDTNHPASTHNSSRFMVQAPESGPIQYGAFYNFLTINEYPPQYVCPDINSSNSITWAYTHKSECPSYPSKTDCSSADTKTIMFVKVQSP